MAGTQELMTLGSSEWAAIREPEMANGDSRVSAQHFCALGGLNVRLERS